jgi:hypothetical protein
MLKKRATGVRCPKEWTLLVSKIRHKQSSSALELAVLANFRAAVSGEDSFFWLQDSVAGFPGQSDEGTWRLCRPVCDCLPASRFKGRPQFVFPSVANPSGALEGDKFFRCTLCDDVRDGISDRKDTRQGALLSFAIGGNWKYARASGGALELGTRAAPGGASLCIAPVEATP